MATVTRTIGTNSRNYSTFTLWEAADGDATAADDAVGEAYNDSTFSETLLINSSVPTAWTVQPATGEGHDGTAASGVQIMSTGTEPFSVVQLSSSKAINFIGIDIDGNSSSQGGIRMTTVNHVVRQCLVHNVEYSDGTTAGIAIGNVNGSIFNNVVYDILGTASGSADCTGIANSGGTGRTYHFHNNTIYDISNSAGSGPVYGMNDLDNVSGYNIKNNIAMGVGGATTGAKTCFQFNGTNVTDATNMSSDATADDGGDTNSLINKVASDQFVSIVLGSEDLHLKAGADAIGTGTDLGTTPSNVQFDAVGFDRDTEAVTWDIGAIQYVAAEAAVTYLRQTINPFKNPVIRGM